MPELKKFLNPMTPFQRMLYTIFLVFCVGIVLFFILSGFFTGFPLEMLIMPVGMFAAFGVFINWIFRKNLHAYDTWWNTLSDAEKTDIEQDYHNAVQVSYYLLAGTRYAFIRATGCVLPYDKLDQTEFIRGKNGRCYMHIYMKNGKKIHVDLPSFSEGEKLQNDLMMSCPPMSHME